MSAPWELTTVRVGESQPAPTPLGLSLVPAIQVIPATESLAAVSFSPF